MEGFIEPTNTSLAEISLNATATNATKWPMNTTIPWDDPKAMEAVIESWLKFQHLPPFKDMVQAFTWPIYFLVTSAVMPYRLPNLPAKWMTDGL